MKIIFLIILVSSISLSCENSNPYGCFINNQITHSNDSILNSDNFSNDRASFLANLKEPLLEKSESKSFRLSYYGGDSFISKRIFRFMRNKKGAELVVKMIFSEEYKNQYHVQDTMYVKHLTTAQWFALETEINARCYWTMPIKEYSSPYNNYILEAYDPEQNNPTNRTYHTVVRSFPEESTDFGKILRNISALVDPIYALE